MNYKMLLMFGILILLASPLISSEIYLWENTIKNNASSVVRDHLYYYFEDTSGTGIGKNKDVPIYLTYVIQELPFNLTGYGGEVDWCNLTIKHLKNEYDGDGKFVNSTTEFQTLYFTTGILNTSTIEIKMKSLDSLFADIDCHYTDSDYLYAENLLVGRWTTYLPAFECEGCTKYSLEELSQQTENQESITANELEIYGKIQSVVDWNFQVWLILSWMLKIAFLFLAVALIFGAGYYFYMLIKNLGRRR